MKIENGLFAGTEISSAALRPILGNDGLPILDPLTGQPKMVWPARERTPIFLEKFSPFAGWAVEVTSEPSDYPAWDRRPDEYGNAVVQPTRLYTAKLVKDGRTFGSATVLAAVFSTWAIGYGEDLARGALYDAMGLGLPNGGTENDGQRIAQPSSPTAKPANDAASLGDAPQASTEGSPVVVPVRTSRSKAAPVPVVPQPVANRPGPRNDGAGGIDPNVKANIEKVAAEKGYVVPELTSNEQAKKVLLDMLAGKGVAA